MPHRSLDQLRTVLTGASSGIGRALAVELARQRGRLVLVARRENRLVEAAQRVRDLGGQAVTVTGDITEAGVRQQALDTAAAEFGGLDCLLNNAGVGAIGPFEAADAAQLRRIMEVNFFAAAELTALALPVLRESPRGIIVNIGSILGHRGLPRYADYCASKFALRGFSETLRAELASSKIDVLLVSPGSTASEFVDNLLSQRGGEPFRAPRATPAEVVARATLRAMRRGKREIVPSWTGRGLVWANRLAPGLVDRLLAGLR